MTSHYFCIGAAKTGTTILARLLDQQPGVACMWEAYFFQPNHGASVFNPDGQKWRRHGFTRADVDEWRDDAVATFTPEARKQLSEPEYVDRARRLMTAVLDRFGEASFATIVGDKWPYYAKRIEFLLEAFPDARYVYNVRDPRGVWNSGQTFKERERGDLILDEMLEADAKIRPYMDDHRFLAIRYEDLISEPETTMAGLGDFLGFSFDPRHLDYDPLDDPLPDRWNWVPTAAGDLDPQLTQKWKKQMTAEQIEAVEQRAAEFMSSYGYDRTSP